MRAAPSTRCTRLSTSSFVTVALLAMLGACGGGSTAGRASRQTTSSQPTSIHAVDLSGVRIVSVPRGKGIAATSATTASAVERLPASYHEFEDLVSGTAAIYAGPATGPANVKSAGHAFVTRVLVRAPVSAAHFSGSVWVEPFNTSGGGDFDAVWATIAPLIEERGDAWVGVTVRAKQVGNLQRFDSVRYRGINLNSNAYAWDALRDVGALLKTNSPHSPLHALAVKHVYLGGYSQSGVDVATFVAAFNRITRLRDGAPVYDGYLLGAHDGNLSPLQSGDSIIPKFDVAPIPSVDAPVIDVEPQTDVEGFAVTVPTELLKQAGLAGADAIKSPTFTYTDVGGAKMRRNDSDTTRDQYRLFEIPGAPHVSGAGDGCIGSSSFPTQYFTRAAAALLARWAEDGTAPPRAPRIELAKLGPVSVATNDRYGNALGGVRSPFVDVPLARYEVHTGPAPTCKQFGKETQLSADLLRRRYDGVEEYMKEFTTKLDATVSAGFLLESDRQAILQAQRTEAKRAFGSS